MKKRFIILALLFIFLLPIKTDAICTSKRYSNLKMTAYKSEVSYELKFDDYHHYYFLLNVNNVDKDILVEFEGYRYEPVDGVVKIDSRLLGGETYEVKLYAGYDTYCAESFLYTKKITVPKYNVYSEKDECIEYEEFYLCNKWYAGNIPSDEFFNVKLESYIKSLKKENTNPSKKDNKSIIDKIIEIYNKYQIIILPIVIVIALFLIYKLIIKIIRRRNRIKLNSR